jgi:hypothetical protein
MPSVTRAVEVKLPEAEDLQISTALSSTLMLPSDF